MKIIEIARDAEVLNKKPIDKVAAMKIPEQKSLSGLTKVNGNKNGSTKTIQKKEKKKATV